MGRKMQGFKVKVSALPHLPLHIIKYTSIMNTCINIKYTYIITALINVLIALTKNSRYLKLLPVIVVFSLIVDFMDTARD